MLTFVDINNSPVVVLCTNIPSYMYDGDSLFVCYIISNSNTIIRCFNNVICFFDKEQCYLLVLKIIC
jgi:hypothetical protein